jgi:protein-tyrosine phosphatase
MKETLSNFWIGTSEDANNLEFLKENNIRCVINCTRNIPNYYEGIEYMRVPVGPYDEELLMDYLPHIVSFIYKNYYIEKKGVLVHCSDGLHRAPVIAAAYILKCSTMRELDDVVLYLKSKDNRLFESDMRFVRCLKAYIRNEKLT